MRGVSRIGAAAFGVCVLAGLLAGALPSAAGGSTDVAVSLQVAPRGPGSVSGRLTASGEVRSCSANSFANDCTWAVEQGTTVELTATPAPGGASSFARWSDPSCGSGPTCTLRVDEDSSSIVALFSPLRLGVFLSGNAAGASVATEPAGAPCTEQIAGEALCRAFPANTVVRVTVTPGSTPFRGWTDFERTTCEPVTSTTCTVIVADEPTSIGARFDDNPGLLPPTISVDFKLRKTGEGRGRVTADKLDCGTACSAKYGFGKRITLTAAPEAGSFFGGWGGVCASTDAACTLPVGPVTAVTALFTRDASAPTSPGRPRATRRTHRALRFRWAAARDNVAISRYRVYRNGVAAGETRRTRFALARLRCGTRYDVAVEAHDPNGNRSTRRSAGISTSPCSLQARVVRAFVRRDGRTRVVEVLLQVKGRPVAQVRLAAGEQILFARRFLTKPGTRRLRLRLPRGVPAGRYTLRVSVSIQVGNLDLPDRRVTVPRL